MKKFIFTISVLAAAFVVAFIWNSHRPAVQPAVASQNSKPHFSIGQNISKGDQIVGGTKVDIAMWKLIPHSIETISSLPYLTGNYCSGTCTIGNTGNLPGIYTVDASSGTVTALESGSVIESNNLYVTTFNQSDGVFIEYFSDSKDGAFQE